MSGFPGKPVDRLTVAALSCRSVPPRQELWLCCDPDCEVVYFGSEGALLNRGDLHVDLGFKSPGDGLVCYCFQVRRKDIEQELKSRGETSVVEFIKSQVRAGNCACEVRNPAGNCCLGEVQRTISRLQESLAGGGT